ncbi:MAG: T9SS type A sorting domain-containing protein, partial [Ferruginibacter sp.]
PAITNLNTTLGVASAERSYNLSGLNLTPAAGNITVTPGANLEISLTSGGPYSTTALTVPYTGGTLASTPVYVRIAPTAPAGAFAGTVNNSGGGATAVDVNVSGGVATNYYNTKANLGLDNLGTWSSTLDGTGSSPANFTDAYAYFNVVNATNTAFNGVFDLTATTSRLVVGNGTAAFNLVVPAGVNNISSTTRVDVLNNATLTLQNNTRPFFNNLATGSTVDFAQTGTTPADTIKVPAISYYNLKLTSGLKYFLSGTVTVRGNFTADAVVSMNGALSPFTTINAFGDVTFQNSAAFEPLPTGDAARLTLKMNGPGPTHNLNSNGTDVLIFRLQRDSTAACTVNTGANTTLTLGNATSGGLSWGSPTATPVLNLASNTMTIRGGGVVTNTALGKIDAADATINIVKSAGATHAGTLRFFTDAALANLNVNLDPAVVRDSILIADDVFISGTLTLTKGKVVVAAGKALNMQAGSAVSGGNLLSFVDGTMAKFGNTDFAFPVGKGAKFAPAAISALSGTGNFTVDYFNTGYGSYTIDPVTLGLYPGYVVSSREYWNINRTNGISAFVTLSYTDASSNIFIPNAIRIAHNDLTDWDDLGGIPNAGNTTTAGFVTTPAPVTVFSPFTFSATSAAVLPVAISAFNVVKQNSTAKISWTTQQETNSREFIVERSANGRNWTAIKTLAAAGNSSTAINYSSIDESPAKGYNYYRVRMIDMDNKFTLTAVKQLYFSAVYSIAVSPNPASDFIKVDVAGNSGKAYTVSVTDAAGRKVYETKSSDAFVNIPAATFTKGVYVVKVADEGNILTQKVVLQ